MISISKLDLLVIAQDGFFPSNGWLRLIVAGILYYKMFDNQNFRSNFPKVRRYVVRLQNSTANDGTDENDSLEQQQQQVQQQQQQIQQTTVSQSSITRERSDCDHSSSDRPQSRTRQRGRINKRKQSDSRWCLIV